MMSSWLRSDTRLPVIRGAVGMPSELSWESWWRTNPILGTSDHCSYLLKDPTLWLGTLAPSCCRFKAGHVAKWARLGVWGNHHLFLLDPLRQLNLDSNIQSMGNNRKWNRPLVVVERHWHFEACYTAKPLSSSRKTQKYRLLDKREGNKWFCTWQFWSRAIWKYGI